MLSRMWDARMITLTPVWADLDDPDWRKEGEEEAYDAIESFFDYLFHEI